ncbi:uncharacterized protein LOC115882853 [Sitophilus oryzae]|uniref:Uncharacterized protein LOC115882853 n=1 Tax=Sitophilus oryzae TaxID=7048 RepID=A0A6J2XZR8_SITOR|nr:uncharacterized protein LOC115882853 [Sitophilus oryzae]
MRILIEKAMDTASTWPCVVIFYEEHNHTIDSGAALLKSPIDSETKKYIFELFEKRHTTATAYHPFTSIKMEEMGDKYEEMILDRHFFPTKTDFSNLWTAHFKNNYGERIGKGMLLALENNLQKNKSTLSKIIRVGDNYTICLCTPIMQRAAHYLTQATEILFVDASGNCDVQNHKIYFFATQSPVGDIRVGCIISMINADAKINYKEGNILTSKEDQLHRWTEFFSEPQQVTNDIDEVRRLMKKGDLSQCKNWRGITLLNTINKIIATVIQKRISDALEPTLRKEQAGFRPQRSCIDQINTLRIIIEQSQEFRSPLYMVFVDFQRAFDTIKHIAIWKALREKGIGQVGEKISIAVGVKQGCILSPLLFNIVLDVVLNRAFKEPLGIQWGLLSRLEDLDYADDLCIFSHSHSDMSQKLLRLQEEANNVGLQINVAKTKEMRSNTPNNQDLYLSNRAIERVDEFQYLESMVHCDGGTEKYIEERILKAQRASGMLTPISKLRKESGAGLGTFCADPTEISLDRHLNGINREDVPGEDQGIPGEEQ